MLTNCKELEYQVSKTYPLFTIKWYNIVDFTNHVEFIDFHIIVLLNCQIMVLLLIPHRYFLCYWCHYHGCLVIIITINDSVTVNDADAIATALLSTLILFQLKLIILLLLILLIILLIQSLLLYLLLLMYVWTKYPSACCCYTCWLEVQTFIVTIVSLLVISKDYYIISYFTIILNCYVLCYCIVCSILY